MIVFKFFDIVLGLFHKEIKAEQIDTKALNYYTNNINRVSITLYLTSKYLNKALRELEEVINKKSDEEKKQKIEIVIKILNLALKDIQSRNSNIEFLNYLQEKINLIIYFLKNYQLEKASSELTNLIMKVEKKKIELSKKIKLIAEFISNTYRDSIKWN